MFVTAPRWLKAVVLVTVGAFVAQLVVVYGVRFTAWLESDATVPVLLAARALRTGSPVATDWYYGNGDVWVFGPHLIAILPVALLGIGQASLWIATVGGFVLELAVLVGLYARLAGTRWVAGLAALLTLAAWSELHVRFVYIQLAYGFAAVLYLAVFAAFAARVVEPAGRRAVWLVVLVALGAVQNPTRGLVFVLAPLVVACAWPWRDLPVRRRAALAAWLALGWLIAAALYHLVLERVVSFAYPPGLTDFAVVRRWGDVAVNLGRLWEGARMLCGARDRLVAVPIGGLLVGAFALVGREVVATRVRTALRVVCVVVAAQLAIVVIPLVVGNLMVAPTSIRYVMPSVMLVLGLAAVLAVRAITEAARAWRAIAIGWLVALPVAALLAIGASRPPRPQAYAWANPRELPALGAELARRGLTHGYASLLNANLLALGGRGEVRVCPVYFAHVLIPQRWLADTACYTAQPAQFFVVSDHVDSDETALRATLPPPAERFQVGPSYDVSVYRTAEVPKVWLEMPIHDGDELVLPLRLTASHPALHRGEATVEGDRLIATGVAGSIVWGPSLTLPRGAYRVTVHGQAIASPGQLEYKVVADGGTSVLARAMIDPAAPDAARPVELSFTTRRTRQRVEILVVGAGGARVAVDDVVFARR